MYQAYKEMRCRASGIVTAVNGVRDTPTAFLWAIRRQAFGGIDGDSYTEKHGHYSPVLFLCLINGGVEKRSRICRLQLTKNLEA